MDCVKNITFFSFYLADYQLFINFETLVKLFEGNKYLLHTYFSKFLLLSALLDIYLYSLLFLFIAGMAGTSGSKNIFLKLSSNTQMG